MYFPVDALNQPISAASHTIDATGEKVAMIGRVWVPSGASKSIRKLHFRFGTVTKAGGSALTVSLQDVDLANGPVVRPDGTPDQTVAIANADAGFTSNTWYTTGNLSADRSVAHGELLAVVIEYDASGRLSTDSVQIQAHNACAPNAHQFPAAVLFTASWATASTLVPTVLFEFSDGTYGYFDAGSAWNTVTQSNTTGSGSTPDENALKFTPGFDCTCDGGYIFCWPDANFDVVLYDGTTALVTLSIDANAVAGVFIFPHFLTWPPVTLTANGVYYLAIKPSSASTMRWHHNTVANSAYMAGMPGGTNYTFASRTDAGAWSPDATKRMQAGVRLTPTAAPTGGSYTWLG
jgi:hypothetical protein